MQCILDTEIKTEKRFSSMAGNISSAKIFAQNYRIKTSDKKTSDKKAAKNVTKKIQKNYNAILDAMQPDEWYTF